MGKAWTFLFFFFIPYFFFYSSNELLWKSESEIYALNLYQIFIRFNQYRRNKANLFTLK